MKQALSKSALMLRDTYELYAKMLAVENIKVVFDEAINAPAKFDILNRILWISPVHATQAHLIPGLTVHEVGHALYSTLTEEEAKTFKRITKLLNIIDDGYQERMMCKKYPNSKKHLFEVFKHFFLTDDKSPYNTGNKLINIINTLNFNCKGFKHGHSMWYPSFVLPEDLKLLREAETIAVHSLVGRDEFAKELAKALAKYGEMPDDGENIGSRESSEGNNDDEKKEGESSEGEDGEGEPSQGSEGGNGDAADVLEELLEKHKDKLNDHHEKIDHNNNSGPSFELPTGADLLEWCEFGDAYNKGGELDKALGDVKNLNLVEKYNRIVKEAKKVSGRIFTKFNMKVQASNYTNTQYKRSGALDPERAALYQVYDDVFMKQSIEPNQQNHAYMIMLDWSSSMNASIYPLCLRIMELVFFAKSAGIEIEVWLYTTSGIAKMKGCQKNLAFAASKFIKVLNTKKNTAVELDQRLKHFWFLVNEVGISHGPKIVGGDAHSEMIRNSMGGTNILEGLILGHYQLSLMEAERKTCFILSDGGDTSFNDVLWIAKDQKKCDNWVSDKIKVYLNGLDVKWAYNTPLIREASKQAIADMYLQAGQRTTAVAWNMDTSSMKKYSQGTISATSKSTEKSEYIHTENVFIDEIVKMLL